MILTRKSQSKRGARPPRAQLPAPLKKSSPAQLATIPRATYRLQFNNKFTLRDAIQLVPYFVGLGVSHIYSSPLLKAIPGSTHGYDVCDFNQLNPEIGTETDLEKFVAALHARGMGLVLDIVPNHMGIGCATNRWWWDVLARGRASRYADYFDINWHSPDPRLRGKVLVPILGERYQNTLEKRALKIHFENGEFTLRYFENQFPLAPESLGELQKIAAKKNSSEALNKINSDPDALDEIIQQQHYRLSFWRNGDSELNYRRFFNIASLASLRTEDPRVFDDVHRLVLEWHRRGWVDGFRIDHIDGLRDSEEYLRRLRAAAPRAWIVVEKILEPGEQLPASWPVAGTTGYDFIPRAGGLFIDPAGEKPLTDFYASFSGEPTDFAKLVLEKNRLVLGDLLSAEIARLVELLLRIAVRRWHVRDFSPRELRAALVEVVACLPVYRTYIRPDAGQISEADAALISHTIAAARHLRSDLDSALFDFLSDVLLLRLRGNLEGEFVARLQQVTGPAMAKGVEDTALYCFNRLIALNEVGGDPKHFGVSPKQFHDACAEAQSRWPDSMLATSTHDTKLSQDVRARISLLSEIPGAWRDAVKRWSAMNGRHRKNNLPGRNIEYRFYQTLVGAWPLDANRAVEHFEKVACEAKTRTTWTRRNEPYDEALAAFVTGALNDSEFIADLEKFVAPLIEPGQINSLAQTLLKLTAPGVPDFYQGEEIWNSSLVDPDNRRAVDFEKRRELLTALGPRIFGSGRLDHSSKLWLIHRALDLRRKHADWFRASSRYEPIFAEGAKANHAVAFSRGGKIITIVTRLVIGLKNDWADTTLKIPAGEWRNELTDEKFRGGSLRLADLLKQFPVALLKSEKEKS
jgi:(1->4)-alpha-D-glucan 1-alpha-D-glucosylmutase